MGTELIYLLMPETEVETVDCRGVNRSRQTTNLVMTVPVDEVVELLGLLQGKKERDRNG